MAEKILVLPDGVQVGTAPIGTSVIGHHIVPDILMPVISSLTILRVICHD